MKKLSIGELPLYRASAPNVRDNLILVDAQDGAKNIAMGVGVYNKGQASEFHTHYNEEEIMVYLRGEGIMRMEDGTEVTLKRGDITFVPPVRHTDCSTPVTVSSCSCLSTPLWDPRRISVSGTSLMVST